MGITFLSKKKIIIFLDPFNATKDFRKMTYINHAYSTAYIPLDNLHMYSSNSFQSIQPK